jgi:DNA repair exonuclease SbcCD ATPase subunit
MSDATPLTYRELGERLGLSPDSARIKAKRRKWQTIPGNHPSDPVRVLVPVEFLNGERTPERKAGDRTPSEPPDNAGEINVLRQHVQTLRELFDQQKATHAAELERINADQARLIEQHAQLQDELQEARAEADHAKSDQVRMARGVATMFDELRALADRHAELHADRARLQAQGEQTTKELDRLRAELEQARRPWWRRLVGW